VQETYLKALRVAERFEEQGGGIRPWLFKILHNVFYTRLAKARRAPMSVDELHGAAVDEPGPDQPGPAWDLSSLDWEHVDERLKTAIVHLRSEYRTVLLLWAVEGLKYREIAEIQDIPIGTVMSRLHRARSILAEQLQELAEESGHRGG
jgi:RNA polymerase sigma-70 factor (ECF subfamily)